MQILSKKSDIILPFQTFLRSSLMEDSWVIVNAFAVILLWYVVLVEIYAENPALERSVVEKG
jgi:hypothetical protein